VGGGYNRLDDTASESIVIPVYNEAENISVCLERLEGAVCLPHNVIIVYDSDDDNTIPYVKNYINSREKPANIVLLKNKYGRGALNAIKTGLDAADARYVLVTMADLSDDSACIEPMCALAESRGADVVAASRYMKGGKQIGSPWLKGLLSRTAGLTLHHFAKMPTADATNNFKLFRKTFIEKQTIESTGGFEIGLELTVKAFIQGYKIAELPTTWKDRTAGKSSFRLFAWLNNYLRWYFLAFSRKTGSGLDAALPAPLGVPLGYLFNFGKYLVSGSVCALLNWLVFYLLMYARGISYIPSAIAAFIVSTTLSFVLSKQIFFSRGQKHFVEYLLVLVTSAFSMVIDLLLLYLFIEKLFLFPMVAKIIASFADLIFNFVTRQFIIFSRKTYFEE
jgi:putative flippase GtrA